MENRPPGCQQGIPSHIFISTEPLDGVSTDQYLVGEPCVPASKEILPQSPLPQSPTCKGSKVWKGVGQEEIEQGLTLITVGRKKKIV